jgi:hypothetical protein
MMVPPQQCLWTMVEHNHRKPLGALQWTHRLWDLGRLHIRAAWRVGVDRRHMVHTQAIKASAD